MAKACDEICERTGVLIFFTCPYADIRMIAENTRHVVVSAQNMDSLTSGRGMGVVLPESLAAAGAKAVVLNHAENQKTLAEFYKVVYHGADGSRSTFGIVNAPSRAGRVREMVDALLQAMQDRK